MSRLSTPISITLPPAMLAELKRLATKTPHEPFTATVRAVIAAGLQAMKNPGR